MKYSNIYNVANNVSVEYTMLILESALLREGTKAKSRNPVVKKLSASLGCNVPYC